MVFLGLLGLRTLFLYPKLSVHLTLATKLVGARVLEQLQS